MRSKTINYAKIFVTTLDFYLLSKKNFNIIKKIVVSVAKKLKLNIDNEFDDFFHEHLKVFRKRKKKLKVKKTRTNQHNVEKRFRAKIDALMKFLIIFNRLKFKL